MDRGQTMTSITQLLTTGHRLLNVLLIEARVALADEDWPDVANLVEEFATRLQRHMHAEETIVFPRLSRLNPGSAPALGQCIQAHSEIKTHIDSIRESIGRRDRAGQGRMRPVPRSAYRFPVLPLPRRGTKRLRFDPRTG